MIASTYVLGAFSVSPTPSNHIYPFIDQETSPDFSRTKMKQVKTAVERCETYSFTVLNNYGLFYPS